MATTTVSGRAYPKRKRAEISYYESSSDEGQVDDEYGASDNMSAATRKKLNASRISVSTKPLPKRKIFPFTSLPAELKNQIYALALTVPGRVGLVSKTKHYRRTVTRSNTNVLHKDGRKRRYRYHVASKGPIIDPTPRPILTPNILLLNRAIYAETQPILYAGNCFALEDTAALHAFLAIIGPKNRATLTNLSIRGWGYTKAHKALNHPAFTLLAGAVNLGRLHLDCQISWAGPRRVARQLYRDGFHWLEAVGAAKGKYDAAVELIEIPEVHLTNVYCSGPSPESEMEKFRAELRKMLR